VLQTVLIKPETLEAAGIAVQKVVQHPGDFIINFPGKLLFHSYGGTHVSSGLQCAIVSCGIICLHLKLTLK